MFLIALFVTQNQNPFEYSIVVQTLPNKILMNPVMITRENTSLMTVIFVSHKNRPKMKAPSMADNVQPKKKAPDGNSMKEMISAQNPEIRAMTGPPMHENKAVKMKLKQILRFSETCTKTLEDITCIATKMEHKANTRMFLI